MITLVLLHMPRKKAGVDGKPAEPPTDQHMVAASGELPSVDRDNLGRFVKGVSGNPKGKPVGARSRTKLMKQGMEEAMTREMSNDFIEILETAIKLAKQGEKDMIKMVLVDLMKDIRTGDETETADPGGKRIEVSITQFLGNPAEKQEINVDGVTVIPTAERNKNGS